MGAAKQLRPSMKPQNMSRAAWGALGIDGGEGGRKGERQGRKLSGSLTCCFWRRHRWVREIPQEVSDLLLLRQLALLAQGPGQWLGEGERGRRCHWSSSGRPTSRSRGLMYGNAHMSVHACIRTVCYSGTRRVTRPNLSPGWLTVSDERVKPQVPIAASITWVLSWVDDLADQCLTASRHRTRLPSLSPPFPIFISRVPCLLFAPSLIYLSHFLSSFVSHSTYLSLSLFPLPLLAPLPH